MRRLATCSLLICASVGAPGIAQGASSAAKAGRYAGETQGNYRLTFTVKKGARAITGFNTTVVAYCVGLGPVTGPSPWRVVMPTFKVSATGRLDRSFTKKTTDGRVTIRVRGDLDGSKLTHGRIEYRSTVDRNECKTDGPQPMTAKRRS